MATYPDNRHATTTPLTPVAFTNSGNSMVYSDNPETMQSNVISYVYGTDLPVNTFRDFEFYSNVMNSGSGRAGIVLKNTGTSAATVTYKGAHKFIVRASTPYVSAGDCANVLKTAFNASTQTTTLAAGATMFLPNATFTFSTADKAYKLCYGRYSIKSNKAGVKARTFVAPSSTTAAAIFAVATMTPCKNSQFSGLLNYTQKTLSAPFDAQVGTAFQIGILGGNYSNTNEYATATPKSGSHPVLSGNYGVIYNLNFKNAANKKVKLIPTKDATQSCYLYSLNNGSWMTTSVFNAADIIANKCYALSLGSASTANLRVVIPGSNFGNLKVEVYH